MALAAPLAGGCETTQVWFSPSEDPEAVIVSEIAAAETSVHVAIYTFTSEPIRDALATAADRGVDVKVYADPQPGVNDAALAFLEREGVPVRVSANAAGGIMHHKFVVIDGRRVLTGSYNFTLSANTINDENLVSIASPHVAGRFEEQFEELWGREE